MSRSHLLALGWRRGAIQSAIETGRLHPVHRGVYAIGRPDLADRGRWLAGVLAAGSEAVLSHRSAAALWGIRAWPAHLAEVTAPRPVRRPRLLAHQSSVPDHERVRFDGIPVTTIPRTLIDLAEVVPSVELDEAVHQAYRLGRWNTDAVALTLADHGGRNGTARLRRVMAETEPGKGFVRSKLERWLRRLCRTHGVPAPESNQVVEGFEVDFLWRSERLIVEADGRASHLTPKAFERDHKRDRTLDRAGYRILRFTHRDITGTPDVVAADILHALRG